MELTKETKKAIGAKARKDARKAGWPSEPKRREGWSEEAWNVYFEAYTDEMDAINNGY